MDDLRESGIPIILWKSGGKFQNKQAPGELSCLLAAVTYGWVCEGWWCGDHGLVCDTLNTIWIFFFIEV